MQNKSRRNPVSQLVVLALLGWLSYEAWPYRYTDMRLMIYALWLVTAVGGVETLNNLAKLIFNVYRQRRAKKPQGEKGTARLGTVKDAKAAKLFKRHLGRGKEQGFFIGLLKGKPIFAWIESSGMVLSPAGGGKTIGFVIPNLLSNPMSMIVPDIKGTLAVITGAVRHKILGHKVHYFNPSDRFAALIGKPSRYNPLQPLINYWEDPAKHQKLMSGAISFSRQLIGEPPQEGDNKFFRNGSRKLVTFALVYLITQRGTATLTAILELLSDTVEFELAVYAAMEADVLGGDLARLAKDISGKLGDGDNRQFESFREGALQVLESYSPSSALAESTSTSDFRFADMRSARQTVYLMTDPTQLEAYKDVVGLMLWAAKTELLEVATGDRVCFLIDEATVFKFEGLPELLTIGREFGLVIWVILQELEQWTHKYGKEARETLLSQTEARVIMGTRSYTTAKLISDELGEGSIRTTSYNTGRNVLDDVTRNVSEAGRKVMTPNEVSQSRKIILLLRQDPPQLLDPVGYHEIAPWRNQAGINPLFGKKFKGKVKARVR